MRDFVRLLVMCISVGGLTVSASGCGKIKSIVKGVTLKSFTQDSDSYAEIKATINVGNAELPSLELPILDPRSPSVTYGKVNLTPGLTGVAELAITVNLTEVSLVPPMVGSEPKLPNGSSLPLAGVDPTKVITLPLGHTSARLYIAIDRTLAIVGVAMPIRQMDPLGRVGRGSNLFTSFTVEKGVRGTAGIFSSETEGQNGFGLFVDASSLLPKPATELGLKTQTFALFSNEKAVAQKVVFKDQHPGGKKEIRINKFLYDLSRKKKKLTIE